MLRWLTGWGNKKPDNTANPALGGVLGGDGKGKNPNGGIPGGGGRGRQGSGGNIPGGDGDTRDHTRSKDDSNDSKDTLPDPNRDTLGILQDKLTKTQTTIAQDLESWKKKKIEIGSKIPNVINLDLLISKIVSVDKKGLGKKILEILKALVRSPEKELEEALKETEPAIVQLLKYLNTACENLKNSKDSSKSDQLRLLICAETIEIFNELLELTNDISREIDLCLKMESGGEEFAKRLISLAVQFLTTFPLPDFNFNMSDYYRKYLYHEVHNETDEIVDKFIVDTESEIAKAKNVLEMKDGKNEIPDTNVISKEQLKEKKRKILATGADQYKKYNGQTLYAANKNPRDCSSDDRQLKRINSEISFRPNPFK